MSKISILEPLVSISCCSSFVRQRNGTQIFTLSPPACVWMGAWVGACARTQACMCACACGCAWVCVRVCACLCLFFSTSGFAQSNISCLGLVLDVWALYFCVNNKQLRELIVVL